MASWVTKYQEQRKVRAKKYKLTQPGNHRLKGDFRTTTIGLTGTNINGGLSTSYPLDGDRLHSDRRLVIVYSSSGRKKESERMWTGREMYMFNNTAVQPPITTRDIEYGNYGRCLGGRRSSPHITVHGVYNIKLV
ncbi:hypothetical protein J6590_086417 [Homalodisca vitripennis]|nr:hypothetical protein J6590_086417 [Homalodisca vitripennis]